MPNEAATAPKLRAQAFADKLRGDMDFRAEVEADPQSALAALGGGIPPSIDRVRVVEDTEDTVHFVLPPRPDGDLSDDELSGVSGGLSVLPTDITPAFSFAARLGLGRFGSGHRD